MKILPYHTNNTASKNMHLVKNVLVIWELSLIRQNYLQEHLAPWLSDLREVI